MNRHGNRAGGTTKPRYQRGAPDREESRWRRSLAEWRLALRIARRSVWRSRGTSIIVALMVLLPVAGFSAAAIIGQSTFPTPDEKIAAALGQNEAKLLASIGTHSGMVQDPYDPTHLQTPDNAAPAADGGERLDEAGVRALFPGADMTVLSSAIVTTTTAEGIGQLQVTVGNLWGEDFAGRTSILAGSAPSEPGDVLVSAAALKRLGASIGDAITVTKPATTLTITGVLSDAMSADSEEWIYAPEGSFGDDLQVWNRTYYLPDTVITLDEFADLNDAGVTVLSRTVLENASVINLALSGGFWSTYGILLMLAAAFAAFEIVLLAGAAFAVGARKQQRALATLASVGGERRMLYRVVTSQGLVLGLLGGIVGVAIGIPIAAIYMRATADGSATQYWGFHAEPLTLAAIALIAMLVGLASAVVPARAAVKFDVLAALRGSRAPAEPSARSTRWGIGYLVVGTALTLVGAFSLRALAWSNTGQQSVPGMLAVAALIVGPIVLQVGMIMCGGVILRAMAHVFSRFGLGARLAARDSAAHRARSVPAFAAIMVTAFIAVIVINVSVTSSAASDKHYWYQTAPGQAQVLMPKDDAGAPAATVDEITGIVEEELDTVAVGTIYAPLSRWDSETGTQTDGAVVVAEALPENLCPLLPASADYDQSIANLTGAKYQEAVRTLRDTDWRCDEAQTSRVTSAQKVVVTDSAGLSLVLGHTAPGDVLSSFESGSAVALSPVYVNDGQSVLQWWAPDSDWDNPDSGDEPVTTQTISAVKAEPEVDLPSTPLVISGTTAEQLGIDVEPSYFIANPAEQFAQGEIDALNARLEPIMGSARVEQGPEPTWLYVILATLLVAGVLFVGASAVAIGLSRADGRDDDATLAAVGATRSLRRTFAFWQAIVLVGLGTVTGTLAGLITTYGISLADTTGNVGFDPPWVAIAALVIGIPLLIAIGSWLVASKPVTLVRRAAIG
ncbi:FtsX-like permease family protein [Paramicrobacterium fandaimingii]|uniref:FtsX-like permease family protein n=1 Tax=Paramicrobacterium fandaimingii TaxID=2708079 RepID=UPI001423A7E3|nr:FtsX-like permease family protein [Microbacterium fandaimingii]